MGWKIQLADNSKQLHKSLTVIFSILLFLLALLEIIQPQLLLLAPVIPPTIFPWISAGIAIAIGVGRYVKQNCLTVTKEDTTNGISE